MNFNVDYLRCPVAKTRSAECREDTGLRTATAKPESIDGKPPLFSWSRETLRALSLPVNIHHVWSALQLYCQELYFVKPDIILIIIHFTTLKKRCDIFFSVWSELGLLQGAGTLLLYPCTGDIPVCITDTVKCKQIAPMSRGQINSLAVLPEENHQYWEEHL